MPRPPNPDLCKPWKLNMPATLAGKVEFALLDPVHSRPRYGARVKLVSELLEWWLFREANPQATPDQFPHVSSLQELRDLGD